jgi:hypothetical protein
MIISQLYSTFRLQLQPKVSHEEVKSGRNDDNEEEEKEEDVDRWGL